MKQLAPRSGTFFRRINFKVNLIINIRPFFTKSNKIRKKLISFYLMVREANFGEFQLLEKQVADVRKG